MKKIKNLQQLTNIAFLFVSIALFLSNNTFSQSERKIIDTAAIKESEFWPSIGETQLSNDGKYVLYAVNNLPKGSQTLMLLATGNEWKQEFPGISSGSITKNSRWVIFSQHDTLGVIELGKERKILIPHVKQFEVFDRGGNTWIVYVDEASKDALVLKELGSSREQRFESCTGFWISPLKDFLVWQSVDVTGEIKKYGLQQMDLTSGDLHTIQEPSYNDISDISFDPLVGHTLLFFTEDTLQQNARYSLHWYQQGSKSGSVIWKHSVKPERYRFDEKGKQLVINLHDTVWYYKEGMSKTIPAITKNMLSAENEFSVQYAGFPENGSDRLITFSMVEKLPEEKKGTGPQVDVWNYLDKDLQSEQALPGRNTVYRGYQMMLNLDTKKIYSISEPGDKGIQVSGKHYTLVEKKLDFTKWWRISDKRGFNLVSLDDGSRQLLPIDSRYFNLVAVLSPHEDFVIYFDPTTKDYWSYEIRTKKIINLTRGIATSWEVEKYNLSCVAPNPIYGGGPGPFPRGIAGWMDGDSSVLLYDSYDIWKVDPAGQRKPVNMTQGYGKVHHIIFELDVNQNDMKHLSSKDEWILKAINYESRYQGFFRKKPGIKSVPEKLVMGLCAWEIKAKATEGTPTYIVNKNSAVAPWDMYITKDFRLMKPLYSITPQKQYHWYTTEVVRWRLPNGDSCTGILYKPDDLDPKRKYPLIFRYYQQAPINADQFLMPELASAAEANVPYFVSRGYLVFMPDIHYKIGHPGEGALQTVESAAKYLMKRPYVDGKHMGLAGHSWGGYETNYIVTHSNLFAAAAEGAGATDFISKYGSVIGLNGIGRGGYFVYEFDQSRMGVTLWDSTNLYLENSPIFRANKITTPLLMLHNKADDAVPWSQGTELFIALWRLGKPAWMLQYDGEGHSLDKEENILDYTIRLTQFFDHYLKGKPGPKWMVNGIPFSKKGSDAGYELMPGKKP